MNLRILILVVTFSLMYGLVPAQAEDSTTDRLWVTAAAKQGGELKAYFLNQSHMVAKNLVSDNTVSVFLLTEANLGNSVRNGLIVLDENATLTERSWGHLIKRFLAHNPLPVDASGNVRWSDWCEYGQANDGFTPLNQVDYDTAVKLGQSDSGEVISRETQDSQQPEAEASILTKSEPVTATSQPASPPTSSRELLPLMQAGAMIDVLDVSHPTIPSRSEMDQFLKDRKDAEEKDSPATQGDSDSDTRSWDTPQYHLYDIEQQKRQNRSAAPSSTGQSGSHQPTEATTRGGTEDQANTTEETRPWSIPRYQWEMEQQKRQNRSAAPSSLRQARSPKSHSEAFLEDYFHDIPEMVVVASCESTFRNIQSELRYTSGKRRGEQERSFGFFQIHEPDWHDIALAEGYENYQTNPMDNVLMARHMHGLEGLHPWRHSKHCWGPKVRRMR